MTDIAVRIEGLGKKFIIGHKKSGDIRNTFADFISKLLGRTSGSTEEFWALRDINLEIKRGDAVGIIGRNGAGKSTLLKVLSRITQPTTGRFEINGRVSSLLEVGTGFHPELTGRENIYLNGTILGMKRVEIKQKFDEIVAFSGVEKFLDTPVKHYSSGMKVRLAFSVAAHLEPEILIVDEVLAVGDAGFQKKCLGKMSDVSKNEGRTVLFVSHNMSAVQNLCNHGLLLNKGKIEFAGNMAKVVNRYLAQYKTYNIDKIHFGNYISSVKIRNQEQEFTKAFKYGDDIIFEFNLTDTFSFKHHHLGFFIFDSDGNKISAISTAMKTPIESNDISGINYIKFIVKSPPLIEGSYYIDISITNKTRGRVDYIQSACFFTVVETDIYQTGAKINSHIGKIYLEVETYFTQNI